MTDVVGKRIFIIALKQNNKKALNLLKNDLKYSLHIDSIEKFQSLGNIETFNRLFEHNFSISDEVLDFLSRCIIEN